MNLTETPETVEWEDQHYVFVEREGPFKETAGPNWGEIHGTHLPKLKANDKFQVKNYFSMYKMQPVNVYRAGVSLSVAPDSEDLGEGLRYEHVPAGKYGKFTLTGPYAQLPEASGRVHEIVKSTNMDVRKDAFFVEHYANDPSTTPEDQLVTHIMIPIN